MFSALSHMILSSGSRSAISLALPALGSSIPRKAHLRYPASSTASPSSKIYPFYEPTGNPTTVSWSIPLLTVGSRFFPWDLPCPTLRRVSPSSDLCLFYECTEERMTVSWRYLLVALSSIEKRIYARAYCLLFNLPRKSTHSVIENPGSLLSLNKKC